MQLHLPLQYNFVFDVFVGNKNFSQKLYNIIASGSCNFRCKPISKVTSHVANQFLRQSISSTVDRLVQKSVQLGASGTPKVWLNI